MNTLFPGALARLNLGDSHAVALGTLRLDSVIVVDSSSSEQQSSEPEPSTSSSIWTVYQPGTLRDTADADLALRRKLSQTAKGANLSKGSPTSPRSSSSKRKRADSTTSSSSKASTSASAASFTDVHLPTLHEIDHLVRNAFIAVEYTILQHAKEEEAQNIPYDNVEKTVSCVFRIYAVPLDAPGLNSRVEALHLKIRSKATKALAQKTFTKLLHHLHYDEVEWKTGVPLEPSSAQENYLLPRNPVSSRKIWMTRYQMRHSILT